MVRRLRILRPQSVHIPARHVLGQDSQRQEVQTQDYWHVEGIENESDLKPDGTAKQVLSHSYLRRWSHAAARGFNPDALAFRVSIFTVAASRASAGHTQ
jgi:phage pi2 protein 07